MAHSEPTSAEFSALAWSAITESELRHALALLQALASAEPSYRRAAGELAGVLVKQLEALAIIGSHQARRVRIELARRSGRACLAPPPAPAESSHPCRRS